MVGHSKFLLGVVNMNHGGINVMSFRSVMFWCFHFAKCVLGFSNKSNQQK